MGLIGFSFTKEPIMPQYVDGFITPVPLAKVTEYKKMSRTCAKIFREHGALAFMECMGDDTPYGKRTSFPRAVKLKEDEVAWFSWIVYASKKDRDAIMKKTMNDPRLAKMMAGKATPFDAKRMIFGGFKVQVSA